MSTNRHGPTHPGQFTVIQMAATHTQQAIPAVLKILMSNRSLRAKWELIRAEIELSSIHPVWDEVRQRRRHHGGKRSDSGRD